MKTKGSFATSFLRYGINELEIEQSDLRYLFPIPEDCFATWLTKITFSQCFQVWTLLGQRKDCRREIRYKSSLMIITLSRQTLLSICFLRLTLLNILEQMRVFSFLVYHLYGTWTVFSLSLTLSQRLILSVKYCSEIHSIETKLCFCT